jgi:hypothetical protein
LGSSSVVQCFAGLLLLQPKNRADPGAQLFGFGRLSQPSKTCPRCFITQKLPARGNPKILSSTVKACEKPFVNGVNGDFDGGFSWIFHCQVAKNTDPSAHDPSRFNTKAVLAAWAAFIRQG